MSHQELDQLERLIKGHQISTETKVNKRVLKNRHNDAAKDLFERTLRFHELLNDDRFDHVIKLDTDVDKIDWKGMPKLVSAFFRPEFNFQPEDITAFKIRTQDQRGQNGEVQINMTLDRNGFWWSDLYAGVIVRTGHGQDGYISGTIYACCQAEQGHLRESRNAAQKLNSLGGKLKDLPDQSIAFLARSMGDIELTDQLLSYAVTVVQHQLAPAESK